MKGVNSSDYEADLSECRQYGEQVDVATNAATSGVVGGAVGAAVGAAIGAVTGAPGTGAALGAAGAGSTGFFGGGIKGYDKQRQIIRNCLRGRGYRVLD